MNSLKKISNESDHTMSQNVKPDPQWLNNDMVVTNRVFDLAIESLNAMRSSMTTNLPKAVELMAQTRARGGRVIITGMGKSGYIARKIAATMASTGAPAMFVHPGEASHGDLGMITEHDMVMALSKSGEAPELSDIVLYTRRFGIPLVAMTENANSTLGSAADVVLETPKVAEACPNGLAPTTSTTAMISLGDAVAMALLERAGLTSNDFRDVHPGGKLGARLATADKLMHKRDVLPTCSADTLMSEALIEMSAKNLGSVIIVDASDKVLGLITDGDLKRHMDGSLLAKKAGDIMTKNPKNITPKLLAAEAVNIMLTEFKSPITSLIVASEDGTLKGLLQLQSCYAAGVV